MSGYHGLHNTIDEVQIGIGGLLFVYVSEALDRYSNLSCATR